MIQKGINLQGTHLFNMSIEEHSSSVSEIFAYTLVAKNDSVRNQDRELCLKIECYDMSQKADGYQALFKYAEKNRLSTKNIYEKYEIEEGRMHVTIIISVEQTKAS
ncbi:MAG: hypothetical protein AB9856_02730 [Cellulosilyticaceae bacterium]